MASKKKYKTLKERPAFNHTHHSEVATWKQ